MHKIIKDNCLNVLQDKCGLDDKYKEFLGSSTMEPIVISVSNESNEDIRFNLFDCNNINESVNIELLNFKKNYKELIEEIRKNGKRIKNLIIIDDNEKNCPLVSAMIFLDKITNTGTKKESLTDCFYYFTVNQQSTNVIYKEIDFDVDENNCLGLGIKAKSRLIFYFFTE